MILLNVCIKHIHNSNIKKKSLQKYSINLPFHLKERGSFATVVLSNTDIIFNCLCWDFKVCVLRYRCYFKVLD